MLTKSLDPFCETCAITNSCKAQAGGPKEAEEAMKPGQYLFLDIQPNPAHQALTKQELVPNYLSVICWYSHFFCLMGQIWSEMALGLQSLCQIPERLRVF